MAGSSILIAVVAALAAALAVYLAARERTNKEKAADLGRGLLVTILVTTGVGYVQHQEEQRSSREALALTLSSAQALHSIDLHGRDLTGFYLAGKDFSSADLHGAHLDGGVLRYSTLADADLHGAHLGHADMHFVHATGANLQSADLRNADLSEGTLRNANLVGADLRGANLQGAKLGRADLREAKLRGAILAGADLDESLLDADLRGAVLSIHYRDATLANTALRHAQYDSTTRWPRGFDPDAHTAAELANRPSPAPPAGARHDVVTEVANADAVSLKKLGPVRLIGFESPQDVFRPFDCYAAEASADVRRLLPVGQRVRYQLGADPRDNFRRALAYLWLPDGRFVNQMIVERGDARPLESPPNLAHAHPIALAAIRAEITRAGLWGHCAAGSE